MHKEKHIYKCIAFRSIAFINQFYLYIMMSCGTSSRLLHLFMNYFICKESQRNQFWVSHRVQWGCWKLTVNFFLPQLMPFIHLLRTHGSTGNNLRAGGRVVIRRVPVHTEKWDNSQSNAVHGEANIKHIMRLECLGCTHYSGHTKVFSGANIWLMSKAGKCVGQRGSKQRFWDGNALETFQGNQEGWVVGGREGKRKWPDPPVPFLICKRWRVIIISQGWGEN